MRQKQNKLAVRILTIGTVGLTVWLSSSAPTPLYATAALVTQALPITASIKLPDRLPLLPRARPAMIGMRSASLTAAARTPPGTPDDNEGTEAMLDIGSADRMAEAASRFSAMLSDPNLVPLPMSAQRQRNNMARLAPLVSRLVSEGFLVRKTELGEMAEDAVVRGLREWQRHYGLIPTGFVDSATWRAMNVPLTERVEQMKASTRRAAALKRDLGAFYVIVNAAAAEIQVVERQKVVASFRAIVGRGTRRTPELVSRIPYIQLAPTWTVPRSILMKDIAPRVRKDSEYLAKHHMRAMVGRRVVDAKEVNWRRGPFPMVVQHPGSYNALGLVRFGMSKGGSYYIHGTSNEALLRRRLGQRFLSSGCVRVRDPVSLAALLMRHDDPASWDRAKIAELIASYMGGWEAGERIVLKKPVRVLWTYMTSWTTPDGLTHFRKDVYGRNKEHTSRQLDAKFVRQI